jgi:hypothetical protein
MAAILSGFVPIGFKNLMAIFTFHRINCLLTFLSLITMCFPIAAPASLATKSCWSSGFRFLYRPSTICASLSIFNSFFGIHLNRKPYSLQAMIFTIASYGVSGEIYHLSDCLIPKPLLSELSYLQLLFLCHLALLSTTLVQKSGNKITAKTPETVAHK